MTQQGGINKKSKNGERSTSFEFLGSQQEYNHSYFIEDNGSLHLKSQIDSHDLDHEDKKSDDIFYKNFNFEIKEMNDEDPEYFTFEGYASTFGNIDRGDDVIEKGAFLQTLKSMMPKLLWQHKMSEPLGVFTQAYEDQKGLYVKGKMPKSDDFVRGRVIPQMKAGSIDSMSIGFSIIKDAMERVGDTLVRKIYDLKLNEVSLVTLPMNPKAMLTGMKTVVPFQDLPILSNDDGEPDTERDWTSNDAISNVRELTNSTESASDDYKKAFLWYDSENSDNLTSYKLPIADVVNNRLVVIPRAVFAAAAAISGARGGVDIPESDVRSITQNINRYYKKMNLDSPLEKGFTKYIEKMTKVSEVCEFLRSFGHSNKETNSLVSAIKRIARDERSCRDDEETLKAIDSELKDLIKKIKGE
jgi:HK97 family phage prohead protease